MLDQSGLGSKTKPAVPLVTFDDGIETTSRRLGRSSRDRFAASFLFRQVFFGLRGCPVDHISLRDHAERLQG